MKYSSQAWLIVHIKSARTRILDGESRCEPVNQEIVLEFVMGRKFAAKKDSFHHPLPSSKPSARKDEVRPAADSPLQWFALPSAYRDGSLTW